VLLWLCGERERSIHRRRRRREGGREGGGFDTRLGEREEEG